MPSPSKSSWTVAILAILLIYSIYVVISTSSIAFKVYLVSRHFSVEILEAAIVVEDNSTSISIRYVLWNPIDVELRILSIQSIGHLRGAYIWTNTKTHLSPIKIKSDSFIDDVVFEIPSSRIQLLSEVVSIRTFILIEITQPTSHRVLLHFYFANVNLSWREH